VLERHRAGASGVDTCAALSGALDELVAEAFSATVAGGESTTAVIALGGYGRCELFPNTDMDVMVLATDGDGRGRAEESARAFLHILWDAGLAVGHSVRTVEEVCALHGTTLDAWVSVLEGRLVCGDAALDALLRRRLQELVAPGDRWLVGGLLEEQQARHERFGNSVKLLEPNIKKSAGALRDLHSLFWLSIGTGGTPLVERRTTSALRTFVDSLAAGGALDADEHAEAVTALDFLFRVRHEMHVQRGDQHDTLEYALQLAVADGLGFQPADGWRGVELFMRAYYAQARVVHRLHRRVAQEHREALEHRTEPGVGMPVAEGVLALDECLTLAPGSSGFADPVALFEAFAQAAERQLPFDHRLRAAVERSREALSALEPSSEALAARFRRVLRSRWVAPVLRLMNDLNVLGLYIPEFGRLVSFFQHNVYHYYTADEHTLIALSRAELLREESGYLREVFRNLKRKDLLYLAVLLHDIAKPLGVADHEITGAAVATDVLARLGLSDLDADIGFLIRHHLVMEQVAFRRNIEDPAALRDFTARFPRAELLDYLYVLTYADLSAVNPGVWTEWKASLLQQLHRRASEVLRRNLQGDEIAAFHRARHEAAAEQVMASLSGELPREEVERHLRAMQSPAYLSSFSYDEVAAHIREIRAGNPVAALFRHAEGYTEVTVIGTDAPFALSRFCAVLAANDATIFDANIFTRSDGVIIDHFRVAGVTTRDRLEHRVCQKVAEDLRAVTEGSLDIDHLFAQHHRKWKRRPRPPVNPSVRTDVVFEDGEPYTIVDVYAPDAVGFLYRVTEAISRLGLDIYFAKIATRVDGIVDAFYVLDRSGEPVRDPEQRDGIRAEILRTIAAITGEELA
jgi:[protein-PII] uridylyltransferase